MLFNGRLRSNIDDFQREVLFKKIINNGINLIHTNANLGTQERVCKLLTRFNKQVFHITKLESDIVSLLKKDRTQFTGRLKNTKQNCPLYLPFAVCIEVDHHREAAYLDNKLALVQWVEIAAMSIFDELGYKPKIILMCKSPTEFRVAIESKHIDYIGGYTNILQSGLLMEIFRNNSNKPIIGFSPFSRGRIFTIKGKNYIVKKLIEKKMLGNFEIYKTNINELIKEISFKIALSCPNIVSLITGIYSFQSLEWVQTKINFIPYDSKFCIDILRAVSRDKYDWN